MGAPPVEGLSNGIAFYADGTVDGVVSESYVIATVTQKADAAEVLDELATDAMKMSAGVGMGSIPEPADRAIRAGKTANGTHAATGQTWSVERRDWPTGKGYQVIYRIKRPA